MYNNQLQNREYTQGAWVWWNGIVKDIDDPHKNGRIKVEIFGHYEGVEKEKLPWCIPMMPIMSHSEGGVGISPTGVNLDSIVFGFFYDGIDGQVPVYIGTLYGRPKGIADTFGNAREEQKIEEKDRKSTL